MWRFGIKVRLSEEGASRGELVGLRRIPDGGSVAPPEGGESVDTADEQASLVDLVAWSGLLSSLRVYGIAWLAIAYWDVFSPLGLDGSSLVLAACGCGAILIGAGLLLRGLGPGRVNVHAAVAVCTLASLLAGGFHLAVGLADMRSLAIIPITFGPFFLAISAQGLAVTWALAAAAWALYSLLSSPSDGWLAVGAGLALTGAAASANISGRLAAYRRRAQRDLATENALLEEARRQIERLQTANSSAKFLDTRGEMDGLWEWDLRTDQVYLSPRWRAVNGYDNFAARTRPDDWFNMIHPYDLEEFMNRLTLHLQGKSADFECEHRIRHRDGEYHWVLTYGRVIRDARGEPERMAGSQVDLHRLRSEENQLMHDSTHDHLTGLPNRNLFLEHLTREIQQRHRNPDYLFGVAFIDLDGFKQTNDTLGHHAGDTVLVRLAQRISSSIRSSDIAARLGGDEFVVLLPSLKDEAEAADVAARLHETIGQPITLEDQELKPSVSIGIAICADANSDAEDIVRQADLAMYEAKRQGKSGTAFFDQELSARVSTQLESRKRLEEAFYNEELEVHYQPIVSLPDGRMLAAEALARWRDSDGRWIAARDFIPLAEKSDLIVQLGRWVLDTACRDAKRWNAGRRDPVRVCVNVSARELSQPDFAERVQSSLVEHQLEPGRLCLELTESPLVNDPERSDQTLQTLSAMGVEIALDDFGTGYSSLSYLRTTPFKLLKVDRSFVEGLSEKPGRELCGALVSMANALKLGVVAEGVETPEQLRELFRLGCRRVQGSLTGTAMPLDLLEPVLGAERPWKTRMDDEWGLNGSKPSASEDLERSELIESIQAWLSANKSSKKGLAKLCGISTGSLARVMKHENVRPDTLKAVAAVVAPAPAEAEASTPPPQSDESGGQDAATEPSAHAIESAPDDDHSADADLATAESPAPPSEEGFEQQDPSEEDFLREAEEVGNAALEKSLARLDELMEQEHSDGVAA